MQTGSGFQNLSKLRQKSVQMQLCGVFQLYFENILLLKYLKNVS